MKAVLIGFFLCVACLNLSAQQDTKQLRIGAGSGILNYYGDLNDKLLQANPYLNNLTDNLDYLSFGISLEKSISAAWGLRLQYINGRFVASDRTVDSNGDFDFSNPNFSRALNVRTDIQGLNLAACYYLDNGKLLNEESRIAPYLLGGIGLIDFSTYGDLYLDNGNQYYYWSDGTIRGSAEGMNDDLMILQQDGIFETELSNLNTEGVNYSTSALQMTFGLGLKFRISDNLNLNLETQLSFTTTDYLDDVSGSYLQVYENDIQEYAAQPGARLNTFRGDENGNNDSYSFTSISLHYNFLNKKEAFNAPVLRLGILDGYSAPTMEDKLLNREIELVDSFDSLLENDSQTYYAVLVEVDSVFYVSNLDSVNTQTSIDTIYKVGEDIYFQTDQISIEDLDDYEEDVYDYFNSLKLKSQTNVDVDTQFLFRVKSIKDTLILIEDPDSYDSKITVVDTFFQHGYQFHSDQYSTPVNELEWAIIKENLFSEEVVNTNMDADVFSYSDYLDTLSEMVVADSLVRADTISSTDTVLDSEDLPVDQIGIIDIDNLDTVIEFPDEKSEDVITDSDNTVLKVKDNVKTQETTIQVDQEEITLLKREIANLNAKIKNTQKSQQKEEDLELENLKRQLMRYELAQDQDVSQKLELEKLRRKIFNLEKTSLESQKSGVEATTLKAADDNTEDIKKEIAKNTASLASIKLLLEGQNRDMLSEPNIVSPANEGEEILLLKREIEELKKDRDLTLKKESDQLTIGQSEKQFSILEQQIVELKAQIAALSMPVAPAVKIVQREVVPTPKVDNYAIARSAIRGQESANVFYQLGSSILTEEAKVKIRRMGALLKEYDVLLLKLDGYTDTSGQPDTNLKLSKSRVESVMQYLLDMGLAKDRIILDYRGVDPSSAANPAFGRRVELKIIL